MKWKFFEGLENEYSPAENTGKLNGVTIEAEVTPQKMDFISIETSLVSSLMLNFTADATME
jgi:hypothetical protein